MHATARLHWRSRRAGLLHLTASIVMVSVAQLTLKLAVLPLADRGVVDALTSLSSADAGWLVWLAVGGVCYCVSMLFWIGALARMPMSLAYPTLSLSFILVFLGAAALPGLGETLGHQRLLGILLVVTGNAVAWGPDRAQPGD